MLRNKIPQLTKIIFACSMLFALALPFSRVFAAPVNGGDTIVISVSGLPGVSSVTLTSSPHELGSTCGTSITITLSGGQGTRSCSSAPGQGLGGAPAGEGTNLVAPDTGGNTGTWSSSSAIGTPGAQCTTPEPSNAVCVNMPSGGVNGVTVAQLTVTYAPGQTSTSSSAGTSTLQCDKNGNVVPSGQANLNPGTCLPQDPCACFGTNQPAYCKTLQTSQTGSSCQSVSVISGWLDAIIKFLGLGIGIIITIVVVLGGIQYITAGGDPQGTAAAKKRIASALVALVAFVFMWAVLQFIIPGGIF
jgi:hypothetical protein